METQTSRILSKVTEPTCLWYIFPKLLWVLCCSQSLSFCDLISYLLNIWTIKLGDQVTVHVKSPVITLLFVEALLCSGHAAGECGCYNGHMGIWAYVSGLKSIYSWVGETFMRHVNYWDSHKCSKSWTWAVNTHYKVLQTVSSILTWLSVVGFTEKMALFLYVKIKLDWNTQRGEGRTSRFLQSL